MNQKGIIREVNKKLKRLDGKKTYHKTIREAIEYYLPEMIERMKNAESIEDAEKKGMITEAEGNKIAFWLYKNNGEIKREAKQ